MTGIIAEKMHTYLSEKGVLPEELVISFSHNRVFVQDVKLWEKNLALGRIDYITVYNSMKSWKVKLCLGDSVLQEANIRGVRFIITISICYKSNSMEFNFEKN